MIVENKHTGLYVDGKQVPVGIVDLDDKIAKKFIERKLVKEVDGKVLEVATPKKEAKKAKPKAKPKAEAEAEAGSEDTNSVDKAE